MNHSVYTYTHYKIKQEFRCLLTQLTAICTHAVRQAAHNKGSAFCQKGLKDPLLQARSNDTLQDFITARSIKLPQVLRPFL